MPINRRSQSRRSHLEFKSKERTRNAFDKQATDAEVAPIKDAAKKKRGAQKKR